jgi:hypothetical protein
MAGLFMENGPCRINNQSTGVDLNPTSWNEVANVYVFFFIQLHPRLLSSALGYSSTSLSGPASHTEPKALVHLSKLL